MASCAPVLCAFALVVCSNTASSLRLSELSRASIEGQNQSDVSALARNATMQNQTNLTNISALIGNSTGQNQTNISALVDSATAACGNPDTLGAFWVDPHWGHYALHDLLFEHGHLYDMKHGGRNASIAACGNSSFAGEWPQSLYCEYRREFPGQESKLNTCLHLLKIIGRRKERKSKEKGVVIHIRIGDVIDDSRNSVADLLRRQSYFYAGEDHKWNEYVKPLDHFRYVADHLEPGQNITLVGSPHEPEFKSWTKPAHESCVYTYAVAEYLKERGHHVQMRVGNPPDDDLAFLVNSAVFVPSGGGYSQLATWMVYLSGGAVLQPPRFGPELVAEAEGE